ncbi:MAG: ABC transporter permease [Candidatus Acidiferrales bacterium]|jgi:putative ABC transport system permease protein
MFLRIVGECFARRPRRKILAAVVLSLGMAVATAMLSVSLDIGDRLAREFRRLGANLLVTPHADSLRLEIGGVDYRPANAGAFLPESDLAKLREIFWRNNVVGFAPILEVPVSAVAISPAPPESARGAFRATLIGTWSAHAIMSPDGSRFVTGIEKTNPWWQTDGRWFTEGSDECVMGVKFAQRNGLHIGNVIRVAAGTRTAALAVTGLLSSGGSEEDSIVAPLAIAQQLDGKMGQYRRLDVSVLTRPEDAFARRDPATMTPEEYDRWYCTPYISSIALQIGQALPGTDVRPIRRVAEGEGQMLSHISVLMWLVTFAALFASALAVGATSAATVLERQVEIGLMKALGAGTRLVAALLVAEQLLLGLVGGALGYAAGILLARLLGESVFGEAPDESLLVLPVILALAVIVTLAGSLFPLRGAVRHDPAMVLRGE